MKKLILCRGIPASGKSTWAKQEVENNSAIRFSKDDLRKEEGLFPAGYFYSKENEEIIYEEERDRVEIAMLSGKEYIIVDNTHLGKGNKHIVYYRELANKYNYTFEMRDFYCSREEAIERDGKREKSVGEEVINKMIKIQGNGGYPLNPTFKEVLGHKRDCVIIDIDGTLAFMDDKRTPYEFDKVEGDRVNPYLRMMLPMFKNLCPCDIIIVSGRDKECEKETKKWLKDNEIKYNLLFMREKGDKRDDREVKGEIYENHIEEKYNVLAVFDDRQKVVDMWRLKYNLPTYQVWYGNF